MNDTTTPVTPTEAQCTPLRATRLGGYDLDAVDDFLDDVADTLRCVGAGHPADLTVSDVVAVRLPRAPLGVIGYNRRQVDELLDRVADTLESAA